MARTLAVLIFPDFQLLDAAGPIAAFEEARDETPPLAYRSRVIARTAGPVRSSSGVQMVAEAFTDDPIDTLIVTGGRVRAKLPPALKPWLMSAPLPAERGGLRAFARGPSSSPRLGCLMVAVPPRIGRAPLNSPAPIRKFAWSPTASLSATARCGPRPASRLASISRWHLSPRIWVRRAPSVPRSNSWSITGVPAVKRSSRHYSKPIAQAVGFSRADVGSRAVGRTAFR